MPTLVDEANIDATKVRWIDRLWTSVEQRDDTLPGIKKYAPQKDVDLGIAREMNRLSIAERERMFETVHGVSQVVQEYPAMVNAALSALEEEIASIQSKSAYEQALMLNRAYVQSKKFRLMFLRADNFDVKKAAARLVLFMEKKKHYFGVNSLVRSLTYDDLTSDDIETLKAGGNQILPSRDQSGRLVIMDFTPTGPKLYKSLLSLVSTLKTATCNLWPLSTVLPHSQEWILFSLALFLNSYVYQFRSYLYMVLSALEDEDTQKRVLFSSFGITVHFELLTKT